MNKKIYATWTEIMSLVVTFDRVHSMFIFLSLWSFWSCGVSFCSGHWDPGPNWKVEKLQGHPFFTRVVLERAVTMFFVQNKLTMALLAVTSADGLQYRLDRYTRFFDWSKIVAHCSCICTLIMLSRTDITLSSAHRKLYSQWLDNSLLIIPFYNKHDLLKKYPLVSFLSKA